MKKGKKGMNDLVVDTKKITRLEVINFKDGIGRELVKRFKGGTLEISIQDDGRTMKLFINKEDG